MMLRTKQVKNDEISIIATGFNTNGLNYMNNLKVTIYRHHVEYANDEISTIATALWPMSQIIE